MEMVFRSHELRSRKRLEALPDNSKVCEDECVQLTRHVTKDVGLVT